MIITWEKNKFGIIVIAIVAFVIARVLVKQKPAKNTTNNNNTNGENSSSFTSATSNLIKKQRFFRLEANHQTYRREGMGFKKLIAFPEEHVVKYLDSVTGYVCFDPTAFPPSLVSRVFYKVKFIDLDNQIRYILANSI